MKLYTRLFPLGNHSEEILNVLLRDGVPRVVSARWPVAIDHPALSDILHAGESTKGFWVSGEAVFSQAELKEISHYEAICRKVVKESPADYDANAALCKRTPLVEAGGESPIRLVRGFALTHIRLRPNMVGSIGDWTQEYIIGSGVAKAFKTAGFTGYSLLPVSNPKRRTLHDEFFQIYSDSILKPASLDCSVERIKSIVPSENGQLRHLGCLSYAQSDLANSPDFSRTAEPWSGWHGWPSWVVRNEVKRTFTAHKLRGWAFRPILLRGTDLYADYLDQWQRLCRLIGQCSRSTFDGGRWYLIAGGEEK